MIICTALMLAPTVGVKAPTLQPAVYMFAGALSFIFTLLRLLIGYDGLDAGIGLYLAVVGAAVATFGAFTSFTAAGGKLQSLTDPNALKSALGVEQASGQSATPPPPPSAD